MAPDTLLGPDAPAFEPKSYDSPSLTPLGSISALTAGDMAGTLDQLVGDTGGFQDPDPTS